MISTSLIPIYNQTDYEGIKAASKLAALALEDACKAVIVGSNGQKVDERFVQFLHDARANDPTLNCNPACKGYMGYPANICVSVNNQICHGIPSSKLFCEGDIISVDLVVELNGYYGDCCTTIALPKTHNKHLQLIDITKKAMMHAIHSIRPGMLIADIGRLIHNFVQPYGYGIIKEYCGHGIGKQMHHAPQIVHFKDMSQPKIVIEEGMCFTIEPMICIGSAFTKVLPDKWTVITQDGGFCAQFEHTVFVTATGLEILTINTHNNNHTTIK